MATDRVSIVESCFSSLFRYGHGSWRAATARLKSLVLAGIKLVADITGAINAPEVPETGLALIYSVDSVTSDVPPGRRLVNAALVNAAEDGGHVYVYENEEGKGLVSSIILLSTLLLMLLTGIGAGVWFAPAGTFGKMRSMSRHRCNFCHTSGPHTVVVSTRYFWLYRCRACSEMFTHR